MKIYKAMINGEKRNIHIECEIERFGKKMVVFREVYEEGTLSKMVHSTSFCNVIDYQEGDYKI